MTADCVPPSAPVVCECCGEPLPVGTRARINSDGVIICVACFEALTDNDQAGEPS